MSKENSRWYWLGAFLPLVIMAGVVIDINLGTESPGTGNLTIDNGDMNTNWDKYTTHSVTLSGTYNITESGVYNLTGTIDNGSIIINAPKNAKVKLVLNNVQISNNAGPAIICYEADDLAIELIGDNYLTDNSAYTSSIDEDINSVIYSKADLSFIGDGSLNVTAKYQDGIVSKDDLTFRSGNYYITAIDDGIRGKDSVHITGGNFDIATNKDAIKSTNQENVGKGFVYIENGSFAIDSGNDGIHAETVAVIDGGNIDIKKSREGIESTRIILNGGDIKIKASDDGINAAGGTGESDTMRPGIKEGDSSCNITINDGNLYINSGGDGIDSNGYVYINGGNVVVDGPTNNGNGALDATLGFVMNGGTGIAVGASGMAENFGNRSSMNNISVFLDVTEPANTKIEIKNTNEDVIISHTSAKTFSHIAAASNQFSFGETYILYINDVENTRFTINDITTTIGKTRGGFRK